MTIYVLHVHTTPRTNSTLVQEKYHNIFLVGLIGTIYGIQKANKGLEVAIVNIYIEY